MPILTQWETDKIVELYRAGRTINQIGSYISRGSLIIRQCLRDNDVVIRKAGQRHTVNEKYFDALTEESSYVLGFIMADGCTRIKKSHPSNTNLTYSLRIGLALKDIGLLHTIKDALQYTGPILESTRSAGAGECSLEIHNEYLAKRLIELGVVKNRITSTVVFEHLPPKFIPDFIRGYFDGDGCMTFSKNNNYITGRADFIFCNIELAEKFNDVLVRLGLSLRNLDQSNKTYFILHYSKHIDIEKLYDLFYHDTMNSNCIYLHRKRDKFHEYFDLSNRGAECRK